MSLVKFNELPQDKDLQYFVDYIKMNADNLSFSDTWAMDFKNYVMKIINENIHNPFRKIFFIYTKSCFEEYIKDSINELDYRMQLLNEHTSLPDVNRYDKFHFQSIDDNVIDLENDVILTLIESPDSKSMVKTRLVKPAFFERSVEKSLESPRRVLNIDNDIDDEIKRLGITFEED